MMIVRAYRSFQFIGGCGRLMKFDDLISLIFSLIDPAMNRVDVIHFCERFPFGFQWALATRGEHVRYC